MIKKLPEIQIHSCAKINEKLNEVIDWINDVSALRVTDKQVTANLPNIDVGELAFLSKENTELKDEIDRLETKKGIIMSETQIMNDKSAVEAQNKNELICPFCQQELKKHLGGDMPEVWCCDNEKCKLQTIGGDIELWQELIDTKKKLDIAVDGLKRIEKLTEPSYKNRNLEALALAVNTFSGEIIEQINQRNNNE